MNQGYHMKAGSAHIYAQNRKTAEQMARRIRQEQNMPQGIQELQIQRNDRIEYIYFAWIGGRWVDLAPYGNRLPE